jgi:hypothetical protein
MSGRTRTWQIAVAATVVAAAGAVGAGSASAQDSGHSTYRVQQQGPGKKSSSDDKCTFKVNGQPWAPGQGLASIKPSDDGKIVIDVAAKGGSCTVSLAAYLAQGADFAHSGQQVLTDFSTVSLRKHKHGTLSVSAPATGCFAQIDLYKGSTEYDGQSGDGHGPAPHGPDGAVIGSNLLASWNGPTGGKDCTTQTGSTTGSTTTGGTTGSTTTGGTTGSTTTGGTTGSTTTGGTTGSTTTGGTTSGGTTGGDSTGTTTGGSTPSSTPTSSAPAVDDTSSPSPSATGSLAHTGGGSDTGLIAGLAVALVAAGGGVTFAVRRRSAGRAH